MTTEKVLTDDQITEQFEWYVDDPDHTNTFMVFARAIEQAVLQSPEIQALRKDAERFRKVINMTRAEREEVLFFACDKDVIQAISAAMEQQP